MREPDRLYGTYAARPCRESHSLPRRRHVPTAECTTHGRGTRPAQNSLLAMHRCSCLCTCRCRRSGSTRGDCSADESVLECTRDARDRRPEARGGAEDGYEVPRKVETPTPRSSVRFERRLLVVRAVVCGCWAWWRATQRAPKHEVGQGAVPTRACEQGHQHASDYEPHALRWGCHFVLL